MLSHPEKRKNCRTVIARLPFLGDMSMQLKKELSALVEKHTWNRVILRIIDTTWNIGHNFRLKDQQKTLMKYGVVYKLTCSCGSGVATVITGNRAVSWCVAGVASMLTFCLAACCCRRAALGSGALR